MNLPIDKNDDFLLELLNDLEGSYPKGYDKHNPDKGNWQTARITLINLKKSLDLNGRPADLTPEAATILGYLDWFIAQSYRFNNPPDFKNSEQYFLRSRNVFEMKEDLWNLIWTDGYMADLYVESGECNQALEKINQSIQTATTGEFESFDDQDHEVISQSYRVLGDAYWSAKDLGKAFQAYFQAAFQVFAFNVIPEDPDKYTTTLYASVCEHITKRIFELWLAGEEKASLQAAECIRGRWKLYWDQTGVAPDPSDLRKCLEEKNMAGMTARLFPPSPVTRSEIKRIVGLTEEMRQAVENLAIVPISTMNSEFPKI